MLFRQKHVSKNLLLCGVLSGVKLVASAVLLNQQPMNSGHNFVRATAAQLPFLMLYISAAGNLFSTLIPATVRNEALYGAPLFRPPPHPGKLKYIIFVKSNAAEDALLLS